MERAGVSERTIRRALRPKNGAPAVLPSWRVKGPHGREYRIDAAALDHWIGEREALEAQTGAPVTLDSRADQARLAWPARPADHSVPSVQSLIEQAVSSAVVPLTARIEELARELGHVEAERDALQAEVERLKALEPQPAQLSALQDRLDAMETENTRLDAITQDQALEHDDEVTQTQQIIALQEQVAQLTSRLDTPTTAATPRPPPSWRVRLSRWWRS